MNLSDLLPLIGLELGYDLKQPMSFMRVTEVDDVFRVMVKLGVKEINVTKEQMFLLVRYYLANVGNDKDGGQGKIMKEGKLDKFFGITLIEI